MFDRAVFLDRDGTLVHARHYPSRPADLQLFPNIAPGLAQLRSAGFKLIMITNQGGLAHGYFNDADLQRMHDFLRAELARSGAPLDAIYHCPHDPAGMITELAIECACRKPQPGMLFAAARDWRLDLQRSWLVGDILHDVEAGNRAGCRTVLVNNGGETEWLPGPFRTPDYVVPTTVAALTLIRELERQAHDPARRVAVATGGTDALRD